MRQRTDYSPESEQRRAALRRVLVTALWNLDVLQLTSAADERDIADNAVEQIKRLRDKWPK